MNNFLVRQGRAHHCALENFGPKGGVNTIGSFTLAGPFLLWHGECQQIENTAAHHGHAMHLGALARLNLSALVAGAFLITLVTLTFLALSQCSDRGPNP